MTRRSPFVGLSLMQRALIVGALLAIGVGVGVANVLYASSDLTRTYLALLLFLAVLAIPIVGYRKEWGLFHPLVFTVLWVGVFHEVLRRLPLYGTGLEFHLALPGATVDHLNGVVATSLLLTALGFAALYVGYMLSPSLPVPRLQFREPRLLLLKVLLVGAVSVAALVVLASEAGGFGRLMLQRGLGRSLRIGAELGGHWTFMVGLFKAACLVWLAVRPADWRRPVFLGVFGLALFMDFAATGSRSGVVMPVVLAAVIWSLHYRRIPYGRGVLVAFAGLVAIGMLGEFRAATRGAERLADVQLEAGLMGGAEQGLDEVFGYAGPVSGLYGIVGRVPDEVGFLYGQSYLSIPAAPIPSAVWRNKPSAGGRLTGWHIFERGPNGGGVPPGTIGEAYWNFHIPGVILVMMLFGVLLKWLACFYQENAGQGWAVAVFVPTLFSFQLNSVSFYAWLHTIIPVVVLLVLFCGLPRRATASRGSPAFPDVQAGASFSARLRLRRR